MPTLTAKPITATPITARPLTAYRLGESADVSRYYLHWDGTQYAEHDEWAMTGFGDTVSEKVIATDPGNGDQYLWSSADGSWALYIADSTAHLTLLYVDEDGSTARSIDGPTIAPGAFEYIMEPTASGVVLTVDGTDYTNANVSELGSITYVCCDSSQANLFKGVWWDRRYQSPTTPADDRFYQAKDGPDALFLEDANHKLGADIINGAAASSYQAGWTDNTDDTYTADGTNGAIVRWDSVGSTDGDIYELSVNISGYVGGNLGIKFSGGSTFYVSGDGHHKLLFTATAVDGIQIFISGGFIGTISIPTLSNIETGAILYNTDSGDWFTSKPTIDLTTLLLEISE